MRKIRRKTFKRAQLITIITQLEAENVALRQALNLEKTRGLVVEPTLEQIAKLEVERGYKQG